MNRHHFKLPIVASVIMGSVSLGLVAAPAATAATPSVASTINVNTVVPATTISDSFTKRTFDLINAERAKVGSRPFVWNQKIADVSQDWANQLGVATMDPNWDFSKIHRPDAGGNEIPAGSTWYRENVGFNFTPEQLVDWWMNSPGHKAAMLDPQGTDAGLGYVVPSSGPYAGWHLMVSNMAAYPTTTAPAPSTPTTGVPAGTQYKTTIWLNLRSGPGTNYDIIGSGVTGTIVTATGNTNGIWYEVRMGSQTGWMSSDYLAKYADATPAPVATTPLSAKAVEVNGALGSATGPEVYGLKDGGSYRNYQLGALIYSPASGAHVSAGAIRNLWASYGFEGGVLGYPTSDEVSGLKNGGVYQNYQGGAVLWSPATGAHISVGPIRNAYAATNFENGELGYPTTDVVTGLRNGGLFQNYQGGAIIYSPNLGAFVSKGAIRNTWASTGFENGSLGYPTSNEYSIPGGVAQNYENGVITHSFATGNQIVSNEMAARYKENSGYLGAASGPKVAIKDGGYFQNFQTGAILYSPATGAQISIGGIRSIWASVGFENGPLGYPTTGELATAGGVYQNYQGGVITWFSTGGGYFVFGGIGSMYKDTGGATGRLGIATSGEYPTGGGNVAQNFIGGTIHWGPSGNYITYK